MPGSLILITGATGFIGAQVAMSALQGGYRVRLSVRREAQIDDLQRAFSKYKDQLQFAFVPDFTASEAFDAALKDVEYAIHLASPLVKPGEDLLTPAIKGTLSLLESAIQVASVKRVVITASVASLIPLGSGRDGLVVKEDIDASTLAFDHSVVPSLDPFSQYHASKLASYTATLDFVASKSPHFSVVTLHPVFVFGQNLLQTSADSLDGTNGMLFGSLYAETPMFAPFRGVHVLDVAEAHIRALNLDAARPVEAFLLSGRDRSWEEVLAYVGEEFPSAGVKTKPTTGDKWLVDTTRAEEKLGFKEWREMEMQVKDVLEQQLGLRSS